MRSSMESILMLSVDANQKATLRHVTTSDHSIFSQALLVAVALTKQYAPQQIMLQVWNDNQKNWELYDQEFLEFKMPRECFRPEQLSDPEMFIVIRSGNGSGDGVEAVYEYESEAIIEARSVKVEWKYWTVRVEVWKQGRKLRTIDESEIGIIGTEVIYHKV